MRYLQAGAIAFAALAMVGTMSTLATGQGTPNAPAHTEITDDGPILVTPDGMTLYTYSPDENTPGKSQCSNVPRSTFKDVMGGFGEFPLMGANAQKSCAQKWPPYLADANAQPIGEFSFIDRPEGGKQWAYRGKPLYQSIRDRKPGDRDGIGTRFFGPAVPAGTFHLALAPPDLPARLKLVRREEGLVFATSNDRPVYTPKSRHEQENDKLFRPILAAATAMVSGDWSIVDAGAGRFQYAYKGKRLYVAPEEF